MCDINMVTLKQLEIYKQLTSSIRYFTLTFKTKDICFSLSIQCKDNNPNHPDHVKRKSPNQKMRYFKKRNLVLEKKLENPTLA